MNGLLAQYGLFLAKTLTLVLALLATLAGVLSLARRAQPGRPERLEVRHLNRKYEAMADRLRHATTPQRELKRLFRERRRQRSQRDRHNARPRLFVLDFHGDIRASAVASLREEVTAVLATAGQGDEVLLRLESAGGQIHGYGLAASQLARLRAAGIRLTVAVDKIAASGGYLIASVADHLLGAPFAILGSIGVVAQLPNFHRLLQRGDIDFEQFTAGRYKRTVTLFGENTDADREKFQSDIEEAHRLLQSFIGEHRPRLDLEQVATGEHWYGSRALELGLIDELRTSDDFLLQARERFEMLEVSYKTRKRLMGWLQSWFGNPD